MGEELTLESKAQQLFERDPLVGVLTIVVAGNLLPGAKVADVDGKSVLLPDWEQAEWMAWLGLCVDIVEAREAEAPPDAKPDEQLRKQLLQAKSIIAGEVKTESLRGDDEIGWWAWAGRILVMGGSLVWRQGVRAAKWAAPYALRAGKATWTAARGWFMKAPVKVTAGMALLAAPDVATKAVKSAAKLAGGLFGGTVSGLLSGLGPIGIAAIAAGIYFAFFHGKGE